MKTYEFGKFRVCTKEKKLFKQTGETVPLTPRVFDLLLALVKSGDRILTKDELLETVWVDCIVEESNLSQSISVLRKALGDLPGNPKFIRTVPQTGYRFIASVIMEDDSDGNDSIDHLGSIIASDDLQQEKLRQPVVRTPTWITGSLKIRRQLFIGLTVATGIALIVVVFAGGNRFYTPRKMDSIAVLPIVNPDYAIDVFLLIFFLCVLSGFA